MPVPAKRLFVAARKACNPEELAGNDVGDDDVGARKLIDSGGREDLAAELAQAGDECICDRLRAAARERPAHRVAEREQQEAEAGGRSLLEREQRMRGVPREEAARGLARES